MDLDSEEEKMKAESSRRNRAPMIPEKSYNCVGEVCKEKSSLDGAIKIQ